RTSTSSMPLAAGAGTVGKRGRDGVPSPSAAGGETPALPECRGLLATPATTLVEEFKEEMSRELFEAVFTGV
ncbi:MAG: hypothetical protein IJ146_11465, partial [Kiritimatiellae bacterium]|nr:hypothetical protein [Kiritimatiellia bacterium]